MTGELRPAGERFSRFCAIIVLSLITLIMGYLFIMSMLATSDISTGEGFGELLTFRRDNVLVNLAVLVLCVGLLYLFWRFCDAIRLSSLTALLLIWTLAAGAIFVMSSRLQPSQDSYVVSFWAMQSAKGDTSYYHFYFKRFPYQFGYALYEELIFRAVFLVLPNIPEGFASMLVQAGNVFFLAVTEYALIRIVGLTFHSGRAQKLTALLLLLSLHGILFSTYMYGNVPGLAFSALAVWAFLAFQERPNWLSGILCALCLALAVILKYNYMIVFIAVAITWLVCLLRRRQLKSLLCLLLCAAAVLGLKDMPQRYYEHRMGEDFGSGISLWGWMALGFNEGQTASGWYDPAYTVNLFEDNGGDSAEAARQARAIIKDRIAFFRQEPGEGAAFFNRKFLSQWNEPSYEVIWNNNVREHYSPPGRIYELLCRSGESTLKLLMNFYQQGILFGFLLALVGLWRRREICQCLLPLIILGGVLYHLLCEAKSQYSFAFFLLMIPIASYGLHFLFEALQGRKNA